MVRFGWWLAGYATPYPVDRVLSRPRSRLRPREHDAPPSILLSHAIEDNYGPRLCILNRKADLYWNDCSHQGHLSFCLDSPVQKLIRPCRGAAASGAVGFLFIPLGLEGLSLDEGR